MQTRETDTGEGTKTMTKEQRDEHCRTIGAHGGAATYAIYGRQHMRTIGKAGYAATSAKIGRHNARALVYGKGWHGGREDSLINDLAFGRQLARIAA